MSGRTFAIGDIHGCRIALEALCESLELTSEDTLISLGDVVDRGPDTNGAIGVLLAAKKLCNVILILGNHEEMMLSAFQSKDDYDRWLMVGGREALDSYGRKMQDIPPSHREFLSSGVDYHETETEIYVHANLEPRVALSEQRPNWLRWEHLNGMEYVHESGKRIICGHTQQKSGKPLLWDGWVCLDTAAYRMNPLSCLEVSSNMLYRSDETGKVYPPVPLKEAAEIRR